MSRNLESAVHIETDAVCLPNALLWNCKQTTALRSFDSQRKVVLPFSGESIHGVSATLVKQSDTWPPGQLNYGTLGPVRQNLIGHFRNVSDYVRSPMPMWSTVVQKCQQKLQLPRSHQNLAISLRQTPPRCLILLTGIFGHRLSWLKPSDCKTALIPAATRGKSSEPRRPLHVGFIKTALSHFLRSDWLSHITSSALYFHFLSSAKLGRLLC